MVNTEAINGIYGIMVLNGQEYALTEACTLDVAFLGTPWITRHSTIVQCAT